MRHTKTDKHVYLPEYFENPPYRDIIFRQIYSVLVNYMKKPYYLILIVLGISLLVFGVIVYRNTDSTEEFRIERAELFDRLSNSKGYAYATLKYPSELLIKEEAVISLEIMPDKNLKNILEHGVAIDTLISPKRLVLSSERRQLEAVSASGTTISWRIKATRLGTSSATVSLGLSDLRTDITIYPITPQHTFQINIPVVETKSKASFGEYIGPIMIAVGSLSLLAGFVIASKDFDKATKQSRKKNKR